MSPHRLCQRSRLLSRAFTLVEILISGLLLTLVFLMLWNLFTGGTRAMEFGTWYSNSITELKGGLRKLREDIGKANFPTTIDAVSNPPKIDDANKTVATYFLKHKDLVDLTSNGPSSRISILEWYMCKPTKNLPPPDGATAGTEIHCKLDAVGKNLFYEKTAVGPAGSEELSNGARIFMHDVQKVEIKVTDPNAGPGGNKGADIVRICEIKITTAHPTHPEKTASETTSCRVAVGEQSL